MKKLTVQLPDDLHKRVRILGIQRGETFQGMVLRLLAAEVARSGGKPAGLPVVEIPESEATWHRPGRAPADPSKYKPADLSRRKPPARRRRRGKR
jgi:hypothetical protein